MRGNGDAMQPEDPTSPRSPLWGVAMIVGILAQLFILYLSFVSGLFVAGWRPWAAIGQAVVGLVLIPLLARRRPWAALVIPVASFLAYLGLVMTAP